MINHAFKKRTLKKFLFTSIGIRILKKKKGEILISSKIIRALDIILLKKLTPNAILWKKFMSSYDLYAVYNTHGLIKNDSKTREKLQALSQVLE